MVDLEDSVCRKCGDHMTISFGTEPTTFCNLCAQDIVTHLEQIVPEPPNAITWEQGVEILNVLQKELYGCTGQL